ncbi:MAG TPA: hypothetical protein VF614_02990 [Chthoniobacteraceae bacterium]|jgi:hypothetical protein
MVFPCVVLDGFSLIWIRGKTAPAKETAEAIGQGKAGKKRNPAAGGATDSQPQMDTDETPMGGA